MPQEVCFFTHSASSAASDRGAEAIWRSVQTANRSIQIFLCVIVVDAATAVAVARVRDSCHGLPDSVASSRKRAPGLVAIVETAEDSSAMLF